MPNEAVTVLQQPTVPILSARQDGAARLGSATLLALALGLVAAASVLALLALVVTAVAAPLLAPLALWLAWRTRGPRRHARSLIRIRTRLRARWVGLSVVRAVPLARG
jgi:hypothetical protein